MKLYVPKITIDQLTAQEISLYKNLSSNSYGTVLAAQVIDKLKNTSEVYEGLYHSHRDYCGLGLLYENSVYKLTIVNDGYGPQFTIVSFDSEVEFLEWLSQENDQSMSLYGEKFNNQTITKIRLDWYLQANYSPVWNDYCNFVHSL